ncbi:MAG: DUF3267 domain-containing protein [Vicinamibacterales bacterium]
MLALAFLIPAVAVLVMVYAVAWPDRVLKFTLGPHGISVTLLAFLGLVALHEAIHGVTWAMMAGKPLRAVTYGFNWKVLTPYAHAHFPMTARAYRVGALMPGIVLGLLPCLAAVVLGLPSLMLVGLLMTAAAGGDMAIVWMLRGVDARALVLDHPTRAGCWVLAPSPT